MRFSKKKHTKNKKKKGGVSSRSTSFRNKKVLIDQLSQRGLPKDLTKRITRHLAVNTINKTRKDYEIKRELKRYFHNILNTPVDNIDYADSELAEKLRLAAALCCNNQREFWNRIFFKISELLYHNEYVGFHGIRERENVDKLEKNFYKLARKLGYNPNVL